MSTDKASTENNNLSLWEAVETTHPDMVEKMTHGAKLSSIDATYQKKRATELWGPYGDKWGLTNLTWGFIGPSDSPLEITLEAQFTSPAGSFPIGNDIAFRKGGDSRKKLWTDTITKALSMYGWSADVFMGKFDDAKYVAGLKAEVATTDKSYDIASKAMAMLVDPKPKDGESVLDCLNRIMKRVHQRKAEGHIADGHLADLETTYNLKKKEIELTDMEERFSGTAQSEAPSASENATP